MAEPIIQFDSSAGSDSLASGAGPATAVNSTTEGTTASTDGAGTTVTFSGATDLSGVSADDVIYLVDATAGNRNFSKVATVDDGADSLTVADAFGVSLSGLNWAIGGKRQLLSNADSLKLFDNNGASGDAMPGWVVEFMDGYVDTIDYLILRRAGTSSAPIMIRGESGASTKPRVNCSASTSSLESVFNFGGAWQTLRDFTIHRNGNTDAASYGVMFSANNCCLASMTITGSATHRFRRGTTFASNANGRVEQCLVEHCSEYGVNHGRGGIVAYNTIRHIGGDGINGTTFGGRVEYIGNLIYDCNRGVYVSSYGNLTIVGNTIDDMVSHGIYVDRADEVMGINLNMLSNIGGDAIKLSATGQVFGFGNNAYAITGADSTNIESDESDAFEAMTTLDPQYNDAANDDYTPTNTSLESSLAFGAVTSTLYPGAIQPASGGGGGGAARLINGGLIS